MKKLIIAVMFFLLFIFLIFIFFIYLSYRTGLKYRSDSDVFIKERKNVNLDSKKLYSLINSWRQSEGRPEFIEDERLCEISDRRAREIRSVGDDDHAGFINRKYEFSVSENYAITSKDEENTLKGWLNSPPHAKTQSLS